MPDVAMFDDVSNAPVLAAEGANKVMKPSVTNAPIAKARNVCKYFNNKHNDCSFDEHCERLFGTYYPYCVFSEGENSKKICCSLKN